MLIQIGKVVHGVMQPVVITQLGVFQLLATALEPMFLITISKRI